MFNGLRIAVADRRYQKKYNRKTVVKYTTIIFTCKYKFFHIYLNFLLREKFTKARKRQTKTVLWWPNRKPPPQKQKSLKHHLVKPS